MSRPTRDSAWHRLDSTTGLSPSLAGLSRPFVSSIDTTCRRPSTPAPPRRRRFRLRPVRSPLLGVSLLFSLPAGTGMFRFPAFASPRGDDGLLGRRVAPFGLPRVKGHLHLAGVFRGLSRPSSPPGARASTARPRSLNSSIFRPTPLASRLLDAALLFTTCTVVLSRLFLSPSRFSSHHVKELRPSRLNPPGLKLPASWRIRESNP